MEKTCQTFQVNPVDLLRIPLSTVPKPPFHAKRNSKGIDLLDELQKDSQLHPLALQIRAAFELWNWSIMEVNFQFLPNLLNDKNTYSIDIIVQDSHQDFHFLTLCQPQTKRFFRKHWPLLEENNLHNQRYVELLVLQHLLPLPYDLKKTLNYWMIESNSNGVTRSQIPALLSQHVNKIGQDLRKRIRELQMPSKRH